MKRLALSVLVGAALGVAGCLAAGASSAAALGIGYVCQIPPQDGGPKPVSCPGWHATSIVLHWTWSSDATNVNCPYPVETLTQDGVNKRSCAVSDGGPWTWATAVIDIDRRRPVVTAVTPDRPPDVNGWYHAPVRIRFSGSDAVPGIVVSGIAACDSVLYANPDSGNTSVTGTCRDYAGNVSAPARFNLRYDATAPVITGAAPGRKPDYRGWYNHPVTWTFQATDALSGIDYCPPVVVSNAPPSAAEPVIGACRDRAGNLATRAFAFMYDATPPARPSVVVHTRDKAVRLSVRVSPDTRLLSIVRTPGRRGHKRSRIFSGKPASFTDRHVVNGKRYRYTISAVDQAGNVSWRHVKARPGPHLKAPGQAAVVTAPPRLAWTPVHRARYYNVQLFRNGRKVLSAWPTRTYLQLRAKWRFAGRVRHLRAGDYDWFVWPGFGPRRNHRFGRLIGSRTFTLAG